MFWNNMIYAILYKELLGMVCRIYCIKYFLDGNINQEIITVIQAGCNECLNETVDGMNSMDLKRRTV